MKKPINLTLHENSVDKVEQIVQALRKSTNLPWSKSSVIDMIIFSVKEGEIILKGRELYGNN